METCGWPDSLETWACYGGLYNPVHPVVEGKSGKITCPFLFQVIFLVYTVDPCGLGNSGELQIRAGGKKQFAPVTC